MSSHSLLIQNIPIKSIRIGNNFMSILLGKNCLRNTVKEKNHLLKLWMNYKYLVIINQTWQFGYSREISAIYGLIKWNYLFAHFRPQSHKFNFNKNNKIDTWIDLGYYILFLLTEMSGVFAFARWWRARVLAQIGR